MRTTIVVLGLFLALNPAPVLAEDRLAKRANAIAWRISPDSSDMVPEALRVLQRELTARGPAVLPEIEAALPESLHLRRIAPEIAAKFPGDAARRILTSLLADPDWLTAAQAAFAAGGIGGVELVEPLTAALRHRSPHVRHGALNALSELAAADEAADSVIALLADPDASVRHSAADLLQDLRGSAHAEKALPALRDQLEKEDTQGAHRAMTRTTKILETRFGG